MILLKKPGLQEMEAFRDEQARCPFSYPSVGITRSDGCPTGYRADRNRVQLGTGEAVFESAKRALKAWKQFQLPWVELSHPPEAAAVDQTVAILARALGLWVLNACRVVYVVEETDPLRRFAVAYGTLPEHAESGEERFQVEWREDGTVWYDILACSRPNQWLSRLGYPYVRSKQKQFAQDSLRAMQDAVRNVADPAEG